MRRFVACVLVALLAVLTVPLRSQTAPQPSVIKIKPGPDPTAVTCDATKPDLVQNGVVYYCDTDAGTYKAVDRTIRYAHHYADAGAGTAASPWTGWEDVEASNTDMVFVGMFETSGWTIDDKHGWRIRGGLPLGPDDTTAAQIKLADASNADIITVTSTGSKDRFHGVIQDITLDGNEANQTVATCISGNTCTGITLTNLRNVIIKNVKIYQTGGDGVYVSSLSNRVWIVDSDLENCGGDGIDVASGGDIHVLGNQIGWSGIHQYDDDASVSCGVNLGGAVEVANNRIYQTIGHNVCVSGNRNVVASNIMDGSTRDGVRIANGSYNTIIGNELYDHGAEFTRDTGTVVTQAGVFIGATSTHNKIVANYIANITKGYGAEAAADHQDYGIYNRGSGTRIELNEIFQHPTAGIYNHSDAEDTFIKFNTAQGNNLGINIDGGADAVVSDNSLQGNVKGILVGNSATDTILRRNDVREVHTAQATTLNANALGGASSLSVTSESGFAAGDPVYVTSDSGPYWVGYITSTAANTLNIYPDLPGDNSYTFATSGNAVARTIMTHGIQIAAGVNDTVCAFNDYGGAATDDFLDNGTSTIGDENRITIGSGSTPNPTLAFNDSTPETLSWNISGTKFDFSDDIDATGGAEFGSTHIVDVLVSADPRVRLFDGDTTDDNFEIVANDSDFVINELTDAGAFVATPFRINAGAPTNAWEMATTTGDITASGDYVIQGGEATLGNNTSSGNLSLFYDSNVTVDAMARYIVSSSAVEIYTGSGASGDSGLRVYGATGGVEDDFFDCGLTTAGACAFPANINVTGTFNTAGGTSTGAQNFTGRASGDTVLLSEDSDTCWTILGDGDFGYRDCSGGGGGAADVTVGRLAANQWGSASGDDIVAGDCLFINGTSGPSWCVASGAGASCTGACTAGSLCSDTDGDDTTNCKGATVECWIAFCDGSGWNYFDFL